MFELIYWDTLSEKYNLRGGFQSSTLHAIWPSTVDSDACFEAAGFTEFEDSDSEWDANWRTFVERVMETLSQYGDPVVQNAESAIVKTSLWDRMRAGRVRDLEIELTPVEQIVLSATGQHFEQVVVNFSIESDLTLICGDDHPIIWLLAKDVADWSFTAIVDAISVDCRQQRLGLDWKHLIPLSIRG